MVSLQVHFGFTELFLAGAYFRFAAGSLFTNRFGFHPISGNSTTPVTIYPANTCHQYPENPGNLNPIQLATTCSKNRAKNKSRDEVHFPRRHAKKKLRRGTRRKHAKENNDGDDDGKPTQLDARKVNQHLVILGFCWPCHAGSTSNRWEAFSSSSAVSLW